MSWENKSFGEYTHVCHFEEKVFGVVLSTLHNTSLIEERWREGEKNIYDLSTIYRPSIDQLSTNYRRSILVTIDQLSTKCRPPNLSADITGDVMDALFYLLLLN